MNLNELLTKLKQLPTLNFTIIDIVQIVILSLSTYYLIRTLYKTRAWILVKGMLIIGLAYLGVYLADMTVLSTIMQSLFSTMIIAIIIMMQPELQRIVEMIGTRKLTNVRSLFNRKQKTVEWTSKQTISSIVSACEMMSSAKTGALIVIERAIPLSEYTQSGIMLNSDISRQMLLQIFEKNTPLHDGAVIISNNKIISATSYLPLSDNSSIDKNFGTRHRAAIGASELTDCVAIVVSEETGAISVCVGGKITHGLSSTELERLLREYVKDQDTINKKRKHKTPLYLKILAPLLSICLWVGIIMETDPLTSKIFTNIPVQIINESSLDVLGQSYTVAGDDRISVQVNGRRSVIETMTADDIVAIADISQMSIVNAVPINVSIKNDLVSEGVELIFENKMLKLTLEDLVRVEVPITTEIIGDDDQNYVALIKELSDDTIAITCTQSIAKTIDCALVIVDATEKTNDFVISSVPTIYDKNGNAIPAEKVTLSKEKIRVQVKILEVQEYPIEVQIKEQTLGSKNYFVLNEYMLESDTIRVAIDKDLTELPETLVILIEPSELEDKANSVLINLDSILYDGMYLAKDQEAQIAVGLDLTTYYKKTLSLDATQIQVQPQITGNLDVEIISTQKSIVLYINSDIEEIQSITIKDLNPTLKLSHLKVGQYSDNLMLTDIEGVIIQEELPIEYRIVQKGDK